ncbi:DNA polymerase III subunit delta [Mesohalobacter halotolerans]|uniref:DNA polymerase III subunit delta n=1 Tax=Mesohalobacter halotolerans TaxID=1883405 RepID=A0A4U5TP58_9FLAO|nr:DNA polymerase III subunit delta [Mesohalobacter halotolerans]MBS3739309.1 DNA polymerase III subunit delta [Psychroflexus sp.]TKS55867.1 DNA polymerase III subunit delta [Mesohalobacter halotolerans]
MENAEALLKRLQQKDYKPIYVLIGVDETYFVDLISNYIEQNVLTPEQKAFNQTILYGKDTDVEELINTAKRYPMMAEYQVIIVREAQQLKNLEKLETYVENPQSTTILVLCFKHKKVDGRKKVFKTIKKKYEFYQTGRIYEKHVIRWMNNSLRKSDYSIEPKASKMLLEFLGNNISNIHKELEKLKQILPVSSIIKPEHIEEHVGISKDYNNFELINAIGLKDEFKAQKIAKYFTQNSKNHPLVLSLGLMFSFFNKVLTYHALNNKSESHAAKVLGVPPYFVKDYIYASQNYSMKDTTRAIDLIRNADAQSKGINTTQVKDGDILRTLLVEIMRV